MVWKVRSKHAENGAVKSHLHLSTPADPSISGGLHVPTGDHGGWPGSGTHWGCPNRFTDEQNHQNFGVSWAAGAARPGVRPSRPPPLMPNLRAPDNAHWGRRAAALGSGYWGPPSPSRFPPSHPENYPRSWKPNRKHGPGSSDLNPRGRRPHVQNFPSPSGPRKMVSRKPSSPAGLLSKADGRTGVWRRRTPEFPAPPRFQGRTLDGPRYGQRGNSGSQDHPPPSRGPQQGIRRLSPLPPPPVPPAHSHPRPVLGSTWIQ